MGTEAVKNQEEERGQSAEKVVDQSNIVPEVDYDPHSEEVQLAATRIQSMSRKASSKKEVEAQKRQKISQLKKESILENDCKALIMQTFEETMSNLINEALYGDFNPLHPPKQYILSPKSGQ